MKAQLAEQPTVNENPLSLNRAEPSDLAVADEKEPEATQTPNFPSGRWLLVVAVILLCGGGWLFYSQVFGAVKKSTVPSADGGVAQQGKATLGFQTKSSSSGNPKGLPASRIETIRAEIAPRSETLRLTGNLMADEKTSVAANTSGIAAEVFVDRGSRVKKGLNVRLWLGPCHPGPRSFHTMRSYG